MSGKQLIEISKVLGLRGVWWDDRRWQLWRGESYLDWRTKVLLRRGSPMDAQLRELAIIHHAFLLHLCCRQALELADKVIFLYRRMPNCATGVQWGKRHHAFGLAHPDQYYACSFYGEQD